MTGSATAPQCDGAAPCSNSLTFVFWAVLAALLLPWGWIQVHQATHSDLLWLSEAFTRLLEGYKVSEFIYETNPPLNMLTYALPVLLGKWTGIPLHYALFFYTSGLILLSAMAAQAILKCWPFLQKRDILISLAFMIIVNTILTGTQYGERDQYVGLALIPFTLMQLALTYRLPYSKALKWPVFLIGAVFILLKPHHGLIPTLLLVHRMIVQRRWTIFKDADFLSLSAMTLLYIGATWFFFSDYIAVILPDVVTLYLGMQDMHSATTYSLLAIYTISVVGFFPFMIQIDQRHRSLILFFLACAMASIIPFYVQGMSFKYHLFPAYSFAACGAGMTFLGLVSKIRNGNAALFCTMMLFCVFCYYLKPVNAAYPQHKDYANLPLSKVLAPCIGKEDCSFFIFHSNMGIVHETAHYTGVRSASRFAALWFLPTLLDMERNPETSPEKLAGLHNRYSGLMAEDFRLHKPEFAIIAIDLNLRGDDFNFVEYFSSYKPFAEEWAKYKKIDSLTLLYSDYFKGSEYDNGTEIKYDVYQRTAP